MTTDETCDQSGNTPVHDIVHAALRDVSSDHERGVGVLRTVTALRAAGLLVEGAPTDDQITAALQSYGYRDHLLRDPAVRSQMRAALAAAGVAPPAPSEQGQIETANQIASIVAEQVERTWPDLHPVLSLRYGIANAVIAAFPDIAARAPRTPHIADEAVQKLRGLGLDDTAIRERLAQATMLACAPVSDELVQVIVRIAAKATITSEDLHQMEHRGIRVTLPRGPAPVGEAKLAEVVRGQFPALWVRGSGISDFAVARNIARVLTGYLQGLR